MDRLKCPKCGLPTIEDANEDVKPDEALCNKCYAAAEQELRVNISLEEYNLNIHISSYLTDEGLVVDVFAPDINSESTIASGYEFFSEAGLHPPQPIEEEPRTIWDTVREDDDGS